MNSTVWFLVHTILNLAFFGVFYLIAETVQSFNHEIRYNMEWLKLKEVVPKFAYLIFWTGIQIYYLVYKKYEKMLMYIMFAVLAFAVAMSL